MSLNTVFIDDQNNLKIDSWATTHHKKYKMPLTLGEPVPLEKIPDKMQEEIIKEKI